MEAVHGIEIEDLKYGLLILSVLTLSFTILLYRSYYLSNNRERFRKIVIIILLIFMSCNIFFIYILKLQVSILYRNVIAIAIIISLNTVIFIKPKEKNRLIQFRHSGLLPLIYLNEIVNVLLNIKVRNKLIKIKTYSPEFKNTFNLIFYDSNNMAQDIYVYNRKYIKINNKYYYIMGMPNLSDIYDIIVID